MGRPRGKSSEKQVNPSLGCWTVQLELEAEEPMREEETDSSDEDDEIDSE